MSTAEKMQTTSVADYANCRPLGICCAAAAARHGGQVPSRGATHWEAAKQVGASPETLRRFQKLNTASQLEGRRWIIVDTRPVSVVMATRNKAVGSRRFQQPAT